MGWNHQPDIAAQDSLPAAPLSQYSVLFYVAEQATIWPNW